MAFFVLATGVGLFGVLSGYLANFFLAPASKDEPETAPGPEPVASDATAAAAASTGESDRTELLGMVEALEADLNLLRARLAE